MTGHKIKGMEVHNTEGTDDWSQDQGNGGAKLFLVSNSHLLHTCTVDLGKFHSLKYSSVKLSRYFIFVVFIRLAYRKCSFVLIIRCQKIFNFRHRRVPTKISRSTVQLSHTS